MPKSKRSLQDINDDISAASGDYQKLKELRSELSAAISAGAEECPDCGNAPHGMEQKGAVGSRVISYYEVGCLVCRDHRAQGMTPDEVVKNWNSGEYLQAKSA